MIFEQNGSDVYVYDETPRIIASFNLKDVEMETLNVISETCISICSGKKRRVKAMFWFNPEIDTWKMKKGE